MLKKILSIMMCAVFILALASCGGKKSEQITDEESSSAEISETESFTESAAEVTTATETETTMVEKIYLDASDEEIDDLIDYLETIWIYNFFSRGFNRDNSSLSYVMPALQQYIDVLYGSQEVNIEASGELPPRYKGKIYYRNGYSDISYQDAIKANRKTIDPLFKFKENFYYDYKWYDAVYFSIEADTVEWMAEELFGAEIDRNNLISDSETGMSCYYCDGRYYFQDAGGRGGGGSKLEVEAKKQDEEGKYILIIGDYDMEDNGSWKLYGTDKATVALIEKNGEKYWKFFEIDWPGRM